MLSKEEGGTLDFSELIGNLQEKQDPEKQVKIHLKEKDFKNDIDNYYGMKNFETIDQHIMSSNLDIDSACQELELTDSKIALVKLIYAKKYYAQGDYEMGDQLLQSVEKSKNKTDIIISQINTIRKNKRFYAHRQNPDAKKISVRLKIK